MKLASFLKQFLPVNTMHFNSLMPFELLMKLLKYHGWWITKESSKNYKIYCFILHFFTVDLAAILQALYLLVVDDMNDLMLLTSFLPTSIGIQLASYSLLYHMDNILELFSMIEKCIEMYGMSDRFKENLLMMDKLCKAFWFLGILTIVSFTLYGIAMHDLPTRLLTPFDPNTTVGFSILFTYLIMATYVCAQISISLDLLPVIFMCYIEQMLLQLCERLNNLKYQKPLFNSRGKINKNWKDNRAELIKCVDYQLKIHAITQQLESTFSVVFLIRGSLTMYVIGVNVLFMAVMQDFSLFAKVASYVILMLATSFGPCYYGSRITTVSEEITSSIISSEWYNEDKQYQQLVTIVMEFSKRPLIISAIGVFEVNLEAFKNICESAYSLFCIGQGFIKQ
jgi:hypothetical protein